MDPAESPWSFRSVLISVTELDRSKSFYMDLMHIEEEFADDQVVILSSGRSAGSFSVTLREARRGATHLGPQALGARALTWDVGSFEELDRVEGLLRERESFRSRGKLDPDLGLEVVQGHDPDRLPLVFIARKPGEQLSDAHFEKTAGILYGLDN